MLKPAASPDFAAIIWLARVLSIIWLGLIYFQIFISKKFAIINADVKASIAAQKEADRLEDLAEEERLKAEREEKKKEKAVLREKKKEQQEKERQEKLEAAKLQKEQALAVASGEQVAGSETEGYEMPHVAKPRLKISVLVMTGIALVALIIMMLPNITTMSQDSQIVYTLIMFCFLPAVALQFVFQGIDFIRVFKKYFKLFGVALIVASPFVAGAIIVANVTDANYFLVTVGNLNPFGKFNVFNSFSQVIDFLDYFVGDPLYYAEHYTFAGMLQNGVALGYFLGVPLYFLIPYLFDKKKYLRWTIKIKYYVCLLIVPISVLVVMAIILYILIYFILLFLAYAFGLKSSSSSSSSSSSGVEPAFNHVRKGEIDGDQLIDLETGRSYKIYNYDSRNGYFEDYNGVGYYFDHTARSGDHVLNNIEIIDK